MENETVAHYLLLERIGAGGLGEVYRARDTRLGRTVALKLVPGEIVDDPERRARFMEDARRATTLSHPAVATLFEAGEHEGRVFLSYEYVAGETVRAAIGAGPMHPKRAIPIAIQVADGLADAHGAGIVHRDLKPDNIIVTPKGAAKVLDFGLAPWTAGGKLRANAAAQAEISTGEVAGTIAYLSPEQALGQPLDARTDIFSLGIVLYEMLTGRNPFAGSNAGDTLINILKQTPTPPSEVNKEVPKEIDPIVLRMLARDVQARYESAAAVASDLRNAYAERTEHVFEPDVPDAMRRKEGGRRWLLAAAALLVAAIALGGYSQRAEVRRLWRQRFGTPPSPIITVIPLNEAGQSQTYFADGITDDLIMRLGHTAGLRVVGRSAMRAYRGRQPAEIASQTGAAVVLTGSVQREAQDLKMDLELIDPADGTEIWRQQFVNPAGSVLAAQAVIAEEVARALRVQPAPSGLRERTMARTVSPQAYEAYARGRDALARRDLDAAVTLFSSATSMDDGLAEAYAGLAEALFARASGRDGLDDPDQSRVRQMASRAATIEPDLAIVQIAQGLAASSYRDTLRHFALAARRDPSAAEPYHLIGDQLIDVDTARAIRMYERSRTLDPRMYENYEALVVAKIVAGNVEEASGEVDALQRALPREPRAELLKGWVDMRRDPGRLIRALQAAAGRRALPDAGLVTLAQQLAGQGQTAEAMRTVDSVLKQAPGFCDARATRVGLLRDSSRAPEAAAILVPLLTSAPPRCAALAGAATGDAAATAAALQRIARDEPALRSWMQIRFGPTAEFALAKGLYPWRKVAQAPDVAKSREGILAAYRGLKTIADRELKGLP